MSKTKFYVLPSLPFGYKDLEPYISARELTIHHQKHHQSYVNGANAVLVKIDRARKEDIDLDMKATLKELSFNIGGHLLHSLFWKNLMPEGKNKGGPKGVLADQIKKEFGNPERFQKEFTQAALGVEGSGWAALTFDEQTGRLLIMQIEKHNTNIYPTFQILMVIDVFEHAYYLDYQNERAKFIDAIWYIINWNEIAKRMKNILKR